MGEARDVAGRGKHHVCNATVGLRATGKARAVNLTGSMLVEGREAGWMSGAGWQLSRVGPRQLVDRRG